MAEYTPIAGSVLMVAGVVDAEAVAGEPIGAGDFIYLDAADSNRAKKAQCDGTPAEVAAVGVALNSAPAAGQPLKFAVQGEIALGAAIFSGAGRVVVVGTTAGKCMDFGDLTSGKRICIVGWSTATNKIKLAIHNTEQTSP